MKKYLLVLWIFLLASAFNSDAFAQDNSKDAELESLKQRVKDLEEQNRAILQLLEEVKNRTGGESKPDLQTAAQTVPAKEASAGLAVKAEPATRSSSPSARQDDRKREPVTWGELFGSDTRIRLYGMLRVDLIADDSRPDNGQSPSFILSEDSRAGRENAGDFTLHPRLTRLGVNFTGPQIGGLNGYRLSGQLEVDFQNGGRESRQIIRIRHANIKLSNGDFHFLAGQTWDVISPLFPTVNNDTMMWNTGNLGDRRPQLRVAYEPKVGDGQLSFTGSAGLTGAIDSLDLDGDGIRDGEDAARPNLETRIAYAHNSWVENQKVSFGLWGHRGWEETSRPVAGKSGFRSQSVGIDYAVPLHERLTVRGEAWTGRNLSDVRGGIGQGINIATGAAIRSRGGWFEGNVKLHRVFTITPGFTIDDPRDEDIPALGRTRNRAWYVANRVNIGGGLLLGADYLRWITDYKGLMRGTDNRFNLFLQYGF